MELRFALLCDSANESREGKINILGEFNTIFAESMPVKWPAMTIVARFEASVSEGSEHTFRLVIVDEDGQEVLSTSSQFPLRFVPTAPGKPLRAQLLLNMNGIPFQRYADYEFHLLVDGRLLASVPLTITKRPGGQGGKSR